MHIIWSLCVVLFVSTQLVTALIIWSLHITPTNLSPPLIQREKSHIGSVTVGQTRKVTYAELAREVSKIANVMKSMGVKKGTYVVFEWECKWYW